MRGEGEVGSGFSWLGWRSEAREEGECGELYGWRLGGQGRLGNGRRCRGWHLGGKEWEGMEIRREKEENSGGETGKGQNLRQVTGAEGGEARQELGEWDASCLGQVCGLRSLWCAV